jgi:hypothetical protein
MKNFIFILYFLFSFWSVGFSQNPIVISNFPFFRYGRNANSYFEFIGNFEESKIFKQCTDLNAKGYIQNFWKFDLEKKTVQNLSFRKSSNLCERINESNFKVYNYELLDQNSNNNDFLIKIICSDFENLNPTTSNRTIYQFNYKQFYPCRIIVKSAVSPDNSKLGLFIMFIDVNQKISNIHGVVFDEYDEIIWGKSYPNFDRIEDCEITSFIVTNQNQIISVFDSIKIDNFNNIDKITKHFYMFLSKDYFKITEINLDEYIVKNSKFKYKDNGDFLFCDISFSKTVCNEQSFNVSIWDSTGKQIKQINIPYTDKLFNNSKYVYKDNSYLKQKYTVNYTDIVEMNNGNIVIVAQNNCEKIVFPNVKKIKKDILLISLSQDLNQNTTAVIPYISDYLYVYKEREMNDMHNVFVLKTNEDIYLCYNDNIENYINGDYKLWKTNKNIKKDINCIVFTKIDENLEFKFHYTTQKNKKNILRQPLFVDENTIYFLTLDYNVGYLNY